MVLPPEHATETFDMLEEEVRRRHIGNRTESTALLAWFLENVWRLEDTAAADAICDGGGDKGIDALYVDEPAGEIVIFQAKHRKSAVKTQGDLDLKTLVGVASYFEDGESVKGLIASKPNDELLRLLQRSKVDETAELDRFSVRLVMVTNSCLDSSGQSFVDGRKQSVPVLDVWDRSRLSGVVSRTQALQLLDIAHSLPSQSEVIFQSLTSDARIAVALISAPDLVRLPGISDLSIFELNVRLGLGRTRINRELADTVKNVEEHMLFPAYHNGLTLLTRSMTNDDRTISLNGLSVVNGCQSLLALYQNRAAISPGLRVLVKFIEIGDRSDLADTITYRTNNQNPVSVKDQRSTDPIQRDLQAQVAQLYGPTFVYQIRNGEKYPDAEHVLDNATAAQLLMSAYMGQPWAALRKLSVFDREYHNIFSKAIDAPKLYFLYLLDALIEAEREQLRPNLNASFSAIRLTLLHVVMQLLRLTPDGDRLIDDPGPFLSTDRISDTMSKLAAFVDEAITSANYFVEGRETEDGPTFDSKVVFKSRAGVLALERDAVSAAKRHLKRDDLWGFHA